MRIFSIDSSLRRVNENIRIFVRKCRNADGGFRGKGLESDLYYTWFGLDLENILGSETDHAATWNYLKPFTLSDNLDLVHLTCLIKALIRIKEYIPDNVVPEQMKKFDKFRVNDKGYSLHKGSVNHSIYAAFLVMGAIAETRINLKPYRFILKGFDELKTGDGGYADTKGTASATTTVTSAALLLKLLFNEPNDNVAESLFPDLIHQGGFLASTQARTPDLLSTASVLMVLKAMKYPFDNIRADLYEFVETMWLEDGGFTGTVFDNKSDCEYTWYGLLSLGVLA